MKRLIITGATGMIGSMIAKIALEKGYSVCCIVRETTKRIENLPISNALTIVECNLEHYYELSLPGEYDIFIHLAWDKTFGEDRDDVDIQMKNIQYTLEAVNLAKRLGCTVFLGAGSQAEYGMVKMPLTGEMPVKPESGYGIAKYTAGMLSRIRCKQLGLRHNWIRIVSTYGINDASYTMISYVINELTEGRIPELTSCEQTWDYLYGEDAARAFIDVAEKGCDGKVYPLGSGEGRILREYVEMIRDIISPGAELAFGKKNYYPHQPMYLVADIGDLTRDTGWKPNIKFSEGIRRIMETRESNHLCKNYYTLLLHKSILQD